MSSNSLHLLLALHDSKFGAPRRICVGVLLLKRVIRLDATSRKSRTRESASYPSEPAHILRTTRVHVCVHQECIKSLVSESADLEISWQSFDHGYFLTVRAIQELRDKKRGSVLVGIGGPSGSGKSRLVNSADGSLEASAPIFIANRILDNLSMKEGILYVWSVSVYYIYFEA